MRLASSLLLATAMGCTNDPNAPVPTQQDEMGTYSCFENKSGECVTWPKGTTIPVWMAESEGPNTPQDEFVALLSEAIDQWNASAEKNGINVRFGEPQTTVLTCSELVVDEETDNIRDLTAHGVYTCVPSEAQWDQYLDGKSDIGTESEGTIVSENIDPPTLVSGDEWVKPEGNLGVAQLGFSAFYGSIENATVFISPYTSDYYGPSEDISPGENRPPEIIGIYSHELGHALGLVHSEVDQALMWPYFHKADEPTQYEEAGLKAMYGTEY